jgi:hypothetical protein
LIVARQGAVSVNSTHIHSPILSDVHNKAYFY